MSKFAKFHAFSFEFDGDTVTARLSPLAYPDMLRLQTEAVSENRAATFIEVARDVTPKYVAEFSGLTDSEGKALTYDNVVNEVYFADLLREVIGKLVEISQPPKSNPT